MNDELADIERHIILACKFHYKHVDKDVQIVLRKIYHKFFQNGSSDEVAEFVILQRMHKIIWNYNLIENYYDFSEFVVNSSIGEWYYERRDNRISNLMTTSISAIQQWQTNNREDGNNIVLGKPDLFLPIEGDK